MRGALVFFLLLGWVCLSWQNCDVEAARRCDETFYYCKLYGPAQDSETFCKCGVSYYGDCLHRAGLISNVNICPFLQNLLPFVCLFCVSFFFFMVIGCTAEFMPKCVQDSLDNGCSTKMCGILCGDAREDSIVLPVLFLFLFLFF